MIKDVLKDARTRKGLKQEEVASLIKVAKQTYLKWENGATEPKASQVAALAKVLGITPNEICVGKLTKRYSLENFIYEMLKHPVRSELETLKCWEHIPDHEAYFADLNAIKKDDCTIQQSNESQGWGSTKVLTSEEEMHLITNEVKEQLYER
ncbi:helix-turn-helix transcriptional regulator [Shewanella putrefaciens]|uniref:helix-turn-helix transcriptional regulator n=1 Tax=Shewanella putrefaciens TaxID=24 RepID=UPI0021BED53C|nr:helix-turn-helix transcriptional regulator [Shewanella putrefaciens]UXK10485.1 helix-turn-helix transcriptional regulator [Shewanella putrefaciens]UXK10489.1 helix-turn-helix transcriptional regulator [Shewanella putrefaciens]